LAPDPLLNAIEKKLGVGRRRVNQLIADRQEKQLIGRRMATLVLARDSGVVIGKMASDDEKEKLRGLERGSTSASLPVVSEAALATPSRPVTSTRLASTKRRPSRRDEVFVVHGRDEAIRASVFAFLRALDLKPMEWGELMRATEKATPAIPEVVGKALDRASAVLVVMTPDDDVVLAPRLRRTAEGAEETTPTGQPRPNVFYEAGMAVARHPLKTIFITVGDVKTFSDIGGFHVTKMNNSARKRNELVGKLGTARGAAIDTTGLSDWLTVGNFEIKET
jgi:predicted nucleotide-binding protein